MIDHVSIPVADIDRAARFYDVVLATLGYARRKERPGAIGYGRRRARRRHSGFSPATATTSRRFYGAFAIDLDGFKIEAVCRSLEE